MKSPETLEQKIKNNSPIIEAPLGDGKAVFLSDMSDEEYAMWEEDQVHGWAKFKKKVFNITKK